jgi:hypothetical protein
VPSAIDADGGSAALESIPQRPRHITSTKGSARSSSNCSARPARS